MIYHCLEPPANNANIYIDVTFASLSTENSKIPWLVAAGRLYMAQVEVEFFDCVITRACGRERFYKS